MKRIFIYVFFLVSSIILAQEGIFNQVFNSGGGSSDYSYDIAVTNDGYTYVTGKFKSTDWNLGNGITLATVGNYDMYVAKFNSQGEIVWAKQAGSSSVDEGRAIAVDAAGNVIVSGVYTKTIHFGSDSLVNHGSFDIFIVKYDADGNLLWLKQAYSSNKDQGVDIAIDNENNYVITGYFGDDAVDTLVYEGTNIISNGERDVFVLKLNSDGVLQWGISGGGVNNDEATAVAVDNHNNIFVTGYYKDTTSVFGSTTLNYQDSYEAFLTKIDPNGNYLWAKNAYGPGADRAYALDLINTGDAESDTVIVVITGAMEDTVYVGEENTLMESNGNKDIFVYAYTGDGIYIAGQVIGGDEDDYGKSISVVPNSDDLYIGGYSQSNFITGDDTLNNYGKKDALLVKMQKDNLVWIKNFGGSLHDYLNSSFVDAAGSVYFTGNFQSVTASFDSFDLTTNGSYDIWIASIKNTPPPMPALFINEFLASNDANYYDSTTADYPDWIEIYNAGDQPVDIGGMYITDDLGELTVWQIPTTAPDTTTIPAGGYLLLLADKKPEAGVLHVKLKLSGKGEQIGLTLSDGTTIVDSLTFGKQAADTSMGRLPDGSETWEYFSVPSPGASNSEGTIVGVEDNSKSIVYTFELGQNYPNPFNPTTTINYSIPTDKVYSNVQLKIYDILGSEVATLVNEKQTAGNYAINFDASKLTSGIYFYKLSVGSFVQTKKMILIK
jgi:hypothetical protein